MRGSTMKEKQTSTDRDRLGLEALYVRQRRSIDLGGAIFFGALFLISLGWYFLSD
jgi:hypothetical protein